MDYKTAFNMAMNRSYYPFGYTKEEKKGKEQWKYNRKMRAKNTSPSSLTKYVLVILVLFLLVGWTTLLYLAWP